LVNETDAARTRAIGYNDGVAGRGEVKVSRLRARGSTSAAHHEEQKAGPSDRLMLAGAAGAGLWVLTWLTVQLHAAFSWALPLVPGFR